MFHEIPPLTEVSAANATVGAIVNSIHNDTIAENNRFFISLGEQHKRAEFYLLCEQCMAPRIGLPYSFDGVHLLLPNKAQKRLTASSLMLTTGCHCGVRRLRPFRLCVPHLLMGLPISQTPYMYLIFDCYTIIYISTQLVCYTIRVIKTTFHAVI